MREYRKGGVRFEAFTEPALKGEITFILSLFNSSPSWQTSPDRHQNISPPRFSRKPLYGTFYGGFSCLFELNRGDISIFVTTWWKGLFFSVDHNRPIAWVSHNLVQSKSLFSVNKNWSKGTFGPIAHLSVFQNLLSMFSLSTFTAQF